MNLAKSSVLEKDIYKNIPVEFWWSVINLHVIQTSLLIGKKSMNCLDDNRRTGQRFDDHLGVSKWLLNFGSSWLLEGGAEILEEDLLSSVEESFLGERVSSQLRQTEECIVAFWSIQENFPGKAFSLDHVLLLEFSRVETDEIFFVAH